MKSQCGKSTKNTLARMLAALMIASLILSMVPAVALASAANSDSFTASSIPLNMAAGQRYTVRIVVKNTGTETWTAAGGFMLVAVGGSDPFASATSYKFSPSDKIKPNGTKEFIISMTAPIKAVRLRSDWQMAKGSVKFGPVLVKYIKVTISANNSRFVSANAPKRMEAMTTATVNITFRNTGKNKWTPKGGYQLEAVSQDNYLFEMDGVYPVSPADSIAMGGTKTFKVDLDTSMFMDVVMFGGISLAPHNYTLKWQLYAGKTKFGEVYTATIQVYFTEAQKLAIATSAVEMAEESNMQEDLDMAKKLVDQLAAGPDKTALLKRIDNEQEIITALADYTKLINIARQDVEKAEASHKQLDVDVARVNVAKLTDGSLKNSFNARLDAVQAIIDLASAKSAVAAAEISKLQADVDAARALVDALPASADKTSLEGRLDAVQAEINAAKQ